MALERMTYDVTLQMPKSEQFGLTNQMRRAAASIPANLAEGYGRNTLLDYITFLRIARGSLAEVMAFVKLASDLNMIPTSVGYQGFLNETDRVLQGLIKSLERKKATG